MITIKTFESAIEAHILKSKLEHEGIPAYIFDENIVTLNPLYNNLVGGVKLKISAVDSDRAQILLKEIDSKEIFDEQGRKVICPRCSSGNFYPSFKSIRSVRGVLAFIVSLFFIVYPPYYKSVRRCRDCDFEF